MKIELCVLVGVATGFLKVTETIVYIYINIYFYTEILPFSHAVEKFQLSRNPLILDLIKEAGRHLSAVFLPFIIF